MGFIDDLAGNTYCHCSSLEAFLYFRAKAAGI